MVAKISIMTAALLCIPYLASGQTNDTVRTFVEDYHFAVYNIEKDSLYFRRFESEIVMNLEEIVVRSCNETDLASTFLAAAFYNTGNAHESLWLAVSQLYCCRRELFETLLARQPQEERDFILSLVEFSTGTTLENVEGKCAELMKKNIY